jgi:methionyl aminopeptidase
MRDGSRDQNLRRDLHRCMHLADHRQRKAALAPQHLRDARPRAEDRLQILAESRRLGPLLAEILRAGGRRALPGATSQEVADALVEACLRRGLEPAMLGYHSFPAAAAVSVNEEIVHGIPSSRVLHAGDLVKVEFGVVSGRAFGAASWTFPVERATAADEVLLETGPRALRAAIAAVSPAHRLGDVGAAIQGVVEDAGLSVVRAFVGHGMGKSRIQAPQVAGVGSPGKGQRLKPGWVLNIQVILKHGSPGVEITDNRWTARAEDGRRGAIFTAMVEVTSKGHIELTRFVEP